jgi:hypothetical protein
MDSVKCVEILDQVSKYQFPKKNSAPWSKLFGFVQHKELDYSCAGVTLFFA